LLPKPSACLCANNHMARPPLSLTLINGTDCVARYLSQTAPRTPELAVGGIGLGPDAMGRAVVGLRGAYGTGAQNQCESRNDRGGGPCQRFGHGSAPNGAGDIVIPLCCDWRNEQRLLRHRGSSLRSWIGYTGTADYCRNHMGVIL
jgi:hypothetical protein